MKGYSSLELGRGFELINAGKYESALIYFNDVLRNRPGNVEAHVGKGTCLVYLKEYIEAMKYFDRAIMFDPKNVEAYVP